MPRNFEADFAHLAKDLTDLPYHCLIDCPQNRLEVAEKDIPEKLEEAKKKSIKEKKQAEKEYNAAVELRKEAEKQKSTYEKKNSEKKYDDEISKLKTELGNLTKKEATAQSNLSTAERDYDDKKQDFKRLEELKIKIKRDIKQGVRYI